jgi:hypothetical protein
MEENAVKKLSGLNAFDGENFNIGNVCTCCQGLITFL